MLEIFGGKALVADYLKHIFSVKRVIMTSIKIIKARLIYKLRCENEKGLSVYKAKKHLDLFRSHPSKCTKL